jgi:hypothetical protein
MAIGKMGAGLCFASAPLRRQPGTGAAARSARSRDRGPGREGGNRDRGLRPERSNDDGLPSSRLSMPDRSSVGTIELGRTADSGLMATSSEVSHPRLRTHMQ